MKTGKNTSEDIKSKNIVPKNPVGKELMLKTVKPEGLSREETEGALKLMFSDYVEAGSNTAIKLTEKKLLLIPPDITRSNSGAGAITAMLYAMLGNKNHVDVMPVLGTHMPMSEEEIREFFGEGIPMERFIVHNWRNDVKSIGTVPGNFVSKVSEGLVNEPIEAELNKRLVDGSYDLIISIGQVVPHEVAGMANYSKNIFVGCGGSRMISSSHMLGAFYGAERIMGQADSPVRKVFDYAEEHFTAGIPLLYILTVTTQHKCKTAVRGLFAGRSRKVYEAAAEMSRELNLTYVDKPLDKVVVFLDEKEFKTTWLGNKAVYRTRMAIADGGSLLILAPGVRKFGEDDANDAIIRKYGYCGRENVLQLCKTKDDLGANLSAASHLIHGSSDGRFTITYAVKKITGEEIENAGYRYMDYDEAAARYDPAKLKEGYNRMDDGEIVYYISNPALGLWTLREK